MDAPPLKMINHPFEMVRTLRALGPVLATLALSGLVSCVQTTTEDGPVNVVGLVTHAATGLGVEGVGIDALTGATPGSRRLAAETATDIDGFYELSLRPQTYVIHPAVSREDDCTAALSDVIVDVELSSDLYVIDFSFVPAPCP